MPAPQAAPGVYASLPELLRLEGQARGFSFLPRQPLHSLLSGRRASKIRGRGLDFEELRAYRPGDDIRSMDWRATMRGRTPYVRVYAEERDRPLLLVVDQRQAMFFGSQRAMKSVVACEASAIGAWRALSQGDRVGALVFDDAAVDEVKPRRSRGTVVRVLGALLAKNHALRADGTGSEPGMLDRVLEQAARRATHDFLVVIVSDFAGAGATTRRLVARLAAHNDVLAVLVHDRLSRELPEGRRLVVGDGELQVELDVASGRSRERLLTGAASRVRPVLSWAQELGVPVLPLDTGEAVAAQVRRLLGAGRR